MTSRRGPVEKCTFCDERLAKGQLPACVEACKDRCLVFGDLDDPDSEASSLMRTRNTEKRLAHAGTSPNLNYIID